MISLETLHIAAFRGPGLLTASVHVSVETVQFLAWRSV